MGDKETRKRRKQRREAVKKDETDDSSPPREAPHPETTTKKKEPDHSSSHSHSLNEPSVLAKLVFCILFIVLIGAVGLIFYTLNEATRDSSDIVEGNVDEVHGEALPIIDDEHHEFDQTGNEDHSDDDEENEEQERDSGSERTIEEILNSIEESVTYNVDEPDSDNQEIQLDTLNNEDDKKLEELDNLQSQSQSSTPNIEETPEQDTINVEDPIEPSTATPEDIYLYNTYEEPQKDNEPEINSDLREELLVNTPSSSEQPQQQPLEERNPPQVQDNQEFYDDDDDDDVIQRSDTPVEVPISQPETVREEIQPSIVAEQRDETQIDENSQSRESPDINEEVVEEAEPQPEAYENDDITNDYDFLFREELDEADKLVEKSLENALREFESLLSRNPKSPRVAYGKARVLDKMAETKRSNVMLENSIEFYKKTMTQPNVPKKLYLLAGNRAVDRLRFRGMVGKALAVQSEMAEMFPYDIPTQNQLAVSFMWMGKNNEAKTILREVLKKDPNSGFAKVHLGFILKTSDQNYNEAIKLLSEGIASEEEGVIDGRFYFHLGDALHRSGFPEKAMKVYEDGVKKGVFLSAMQRSLYNVDGLTGKPWWKPNETPYLKDIQILEKNWLVIRNEALSLLSDSRKGFEPEAEGLKDTGDWQQFNLFLRGQKLAQNCKRAPRTCDLIEDIPKAATCKRGQVKFSIMQPGTHVFAHTGPTNCRLRAHLGLVTPKGPRIRVGNDTKEWTEGKVIIFDDSFEHEVWHDGDSQRIVLIIDFWHPELTDKVIRTLTPI